MQTSNSLCKCLSELSLNTQHAPKRITHLSRGRPIRTSFHRRFSTSIHRAADNDRDRPAVDSAQPQRVPPRMNLSGIASSTNYRAPSPQQQSTQPQPDTERRRSGSAALAELIEAEQKRHSTQSIFGSGQSTRDIYGAGGSLSRRSTAPSRFDPASMVPRSNRDVNKAVGDALRGDINELTAEKREIQLRLTPSLGKQFHVTPTFDVSRAISTMEKQINSNGNNTKGELIKQKYHIRRGQAKKINRRIRWRALFMEGYLAEMARARKMAKQGW